MRKFFIISILLILLILSTCLLASASDLGFTGKVIGIIDGDTIEFLHNGKPERIRLHGIDCPERNQAYETKAKEFASDLAFKQNVTIYDRNDR